MKNTTVQDQILDNETLSFLQGFSNIQAQMAHLSIPEQRKKIKEMFLIPEENLDSVQKVQNQEISGKHGKLPLRIITPKVSKGNSVLVFFHRGGWVYGSVDESESLCRKVANHTGCLVVIVDYRLAPENKFPIPIEDCYDAINWVSKHLTQDGKKLVTIGESAGGNLAAAVSLIARKMKGPKIDAQVLMYPILTSNLEIECYEKSPDKYLLSYENMQWFWEQYLNNESDGENELASPLKAKDFADLPKTLMMIPEYDALKREGLSYRDQLQKADVEVISKQYSKVIHGFLDIPIVSSQVQIAFDDLRIFLDNLN